VASTRTPGHGGTIGAYLGLVPTESQSGARHGRGPITKGRQLARPPASGRGCLAHRQPLRASAAIERRRTGRRPEVRARAERAGVRLHQRWVHLERRRGLRSTVVATAVARELAGWCWSLAVME
jgi:hypothetical protein